MKILLVEDEEPLARAVTQLLSEAGHIVSWANDGEEASLRGRAEPFDLVILDVLLPKKNGWDVLTDLRGARVNVPVLMLTAMDDVTDKVKGLDLGADDYLPKPFDTQELLARVNALHRRDKAHKGSVIRIADLEIDRATRSVRRAGEEVALTRREYDLLEALAVNEGRVLSRELIQERVWGNDESHSNTVDVYIGALRRKIDAKSAAKLIHTAVGFGYVLRADTPS